jgi:hypothetical protein
MFDPDSLPVPRTEEQKTLRTGQRLIFQLSLAFGEGSPRHEANMRLYPIQSLSSRFPWKATIKTPTNAPTPQSINQCLTLSCPALSHMKLSATVTVVVHTMHTKPATMNTTSPHFTHLLVATPL